jgi:hypothetical protein
MGLRGPQQDRSKDAEIVEKYRVGRTLADIGKDYGVCRERIRQILKRNGVTGSQGGVAVQIRTRHEKRLEKEVARWGCTYAEKQRIAKYWMERCGKDPRRDYVEHRANSAKRGIPFEFTFKQWMDAWGDNYERMSIRNGGLVMCRYGDTGPYRVGNIYLASNSQNIKDYWVRKKKACTVQKDSIG